MSIIVKEPERKKKDPVSWAKYTWVEELTGGYTLRVEDRFLARIYEAAGLWKTAIKTAEGIDRADHSDLETAVKYVDRLLYTKFPHVWTVTNARCIISPWAGNIEDLLIEPVRPSSEKSGSV